MDGTFVGLCVNVNRCSLVLHQLPLTSQIIVTDTTYGLKSTERVFEICSVATRLLAYIVNDFALLCGTCARHIVPTSIHVTTIQYTFIDTCIHNVYFKGYLILLIFYVLSCGWL